MNGSYLVSNRPELFHGVSRKFTIRNPVRLRSNFCRETERRYPRSIFYSQGENMQMFREVFESSNWHPIVRQVSFTQRVCIGDKENSFSSFDTSLTTIFLFLSLRIIETSLVVYIKRK